MSKKNTATAPATLEEAIAQNTALQEQVNAQTQENTELKDMVKDLVEQNRALTATKGNKLPLGSAGGSTQVQIMVEKAVINKREMTAAEIAADPELCQRLLAKGSSLVKLVNA